MFKETALRYHIMFVPPLHFLIDEIVPETIVVVVVVNRDERVVVDLILRLPVEGVLCNAVRPSMRFLVEVGRACLDLRLDFEILDATLSMVDLSSLRIALIHIMNGLVDLIILIIDPILRHQHPLDLLLLRTIVVLLVFSVAQLISVELVEFQLLHHLLALLHVEADLVRGHEFADDFG